MQNRSIFEIGLVNLSLNYTEARKLKKPYYAVVKLLPIQLKGSIEFEIGINNKNGLYTNPPLVPNQEYRFGIAISIGNDTFYYNPCSRTFIPRQREVTRGWIFFILLSGMLFLVGLTFIGLLVYIKTSDPEQLRGFFIFWSKPTNRGSLFKDANVSRSRDRLTLITANAYELEEDDLSRERKSFSDINTFEVKSHPIPVSELSDYVAQMQEDCAFKQEYSSVPRGQWAKWDEGRLPENKGKNRYGNLLAYDHNRVILALEKDEDIIENEAEVPLDEDYAPTDYINASFIDGYKAPHRYIATQGPLRSTIIDFWKMIWQYDSRHIVMLTNVEELGKMKCVKYWPENISTFGTIRVKLVKTQTYADYIIRKFLIEKKGFPEKEVYHYHFTSWPDHTVPAYTTSLISFIKKIRENEYYKNKNQPITVHCSAGVGRTGTLIMIDAMLEMSQHEKQIDILSYLCHIRKQRVNMVEKLQQYIFVHQILVEILSKENTDIECGHLDSYVMRLKYHDAVTKKTLLESQFETLNKLYGVSSKEVSAAALTNPTRNRNQEIVPANSARVILNSPEDYINAIYVNGYKIKDAYILTEVPLPDCQSIFWKMIDSCNIKVIALLSDLFQSDIYWPHVIAETHCYGNVEVELIEEEVGEKIIIRAFRVNNKLVKQLQLRNWIPSLKTSHCSQRLVEFYDTVEKHRIESMSYQIVVQCLNGCTSSGVYCGASFICDRIKEEQRVDAFLAASI
ncbi:tyrosine phosphatase: receptor type: K-like protein, partial [Dinothrombium tinctorium]